MQIRAWRATHYAHYVYNVFQSSSTAQRKSVAGLDQGRKTIDEVVVGPPSFVLRRNNQKRTSEKLKECVVRSYRFYALLQLFVRRALHRVARDRPGQKRRRLGRIYRCDSIGLQRVDLGHR